jgi:hypothetical protein
MDRARQIAAIYARHPSVWTIGVAGSTARGEADPHSDLDLIVLWETLDPGWFEPAPLAALGARRFTHLETDPEGGRLEQYHWDELKVDVAHGSLEREGRRIRSVLEGCSLDPAAHKALAALADAQPLYRGEKLEALQAGLAAWPAELVRGVIDQYLFIFPSFAMRELTLERGDMLGFYDYALRGARSVVGLLFALNRRFLAAEAELKGALAGLERLLDRPADARARLERLLVHPAPESIEDFYALVDEVLTRIEKAAPGIDTVRARAVLRLGHRASGPRP